MKRRIYYSLLLFVLAAIASCQKEFLQKPETTGSTTIETIFENTVNAQAAIAKVYEEALVQGLPGSGLAYGALSSIAGEVGRGWNWHDTYRIANQGLSASGDTSDDFGANWRVIRRAYLVRENIDNVKDMDASMKEWVKAEMTGMIAYRYMGMFIRYGGVPLISKSLTIDDNMDIRRASLQATLDTILILCDEAYKGLPDRWPAHFSGRLTKGIALAIKAKALLFAARPLFNSAQPYLSLGQHNDLISFGSENKQRWTEAINANEAVLSWASQNGYELINTGNPFADYGTATSIPSNKEVLLAYKQNRTSDNQNRVIKFYRMSSYQTWESWDPGYSGVSTNFVERYRKSNGEDQVWPKLGEGPWPYLDYNTKMKEMEPRFLADHFAHGIDPLNNLGDNGWSARSISRGVNQQGSYGYGSSNSVKFFYKAGNRNWMELPLFRVAEFYLNLAEAYNEAGNATKSLEYLNKIRNRGGLANVTETDQSRLRELIYREWDIEFFNELKRYFNVKHWRLPNVGSILAGNVREFQFNTNGQSATRPENLLSYYDQVVYTAYWHPKMHLEPFPQAEINKGSLVQNPGY